MLKGDIEPNPLLRPRVTVRDAAGYFGFIIVFVVGVWYVDQRLYR